MVVYEKEVAANDMILNDSGDDSNNNNDNGNNNDDNANEERFD